MNDADSFLRTIIDDPDNDTPRLVFADWLDEHGQGEEAAVVRRPDTTAQQTLLLFKQPFDEDLTTATKNSFDIAVPLPPLRRPVLRLKLPSCIIHRLAVRRFGPKQMFFGPVTGELKFLCPAEAIRFRALMIPAGPHPDDFTSLVDNGEVLLPPNNSVELSAGSRDACWLRIRLDLIPIGFRTEQESFERAISEMNDSIAAGLRVPSRFFAGRP